MAAVRNKRELNASVRGALDAIKMYKSDVKEELREYKKLARIVRDTRDAYEKTRIAAERRGSSRNEKRNARAEESYRFACLEYDRVSTRIVTTLGFIEREYSKLIDAYRSRSNIKRAERVHREYDEYREGVLKLMEKSGEADGHVPIIDTPEKTLDEDGPDGEPAPALAPAPDPAPSVRPAAVSSTVTSVTVAPVTIDVTPIVERAIDSVIERLDAGLTKKIEEYIKGFNIPSYGYSTVSAVPAPRPGALERGAAAELSSELLAEEEHIVEKLRGMCSSISVLLDELTALSSTYHDISLKCRELAELQRTVNDMQRHTAREQKGVQVNQKLVADEQAEIIAAEALVVESQRELAEKQSALAAMQSEVAALAAENAEAVEGAIARERELAEKQRELDAHGRKLADTAEQALARQSELYLEQKEALSRTKKLIREQKQLTEKATSPKKKASVKSQTASEDTVSVELAETEAKE